MNACTAPERIVPGKPSSFFFQEHAARYRAAGRLARGRRVLDVGCGTGYGTAHLARFAALAVGIDRAPAALTAAAHCAARANLAFVEADACRLPFSADAFDLVCAFEVIEHLDRPDDLLQEAHRVLTRGGRLLVSTPNRRRWPMVGLNPWHRFEWTPSEFERVLRRHFRWVRCLGQVCRRPVRRWAANALARAAARTARLIPARLGPSAAAPRPSAPIADLDRVDVAGFAFHRHEVDRADYVLAVCRA